MEGKIWHKLWQGTDKSPRQAEEKTASSQAARFALAAQLTEQFHQGRNYQQSLGGMSTKFRTEN